MVTMTLELTYEKAQQLIVEERLSARTKNRDMEFEPAMEHVFNKNEQLYRRLA